MDKLEEVCRAVCRAKDVDPDVEAVGLGRCMPQGLKYRLWEYQKPFVEQVLALYGVEA